MRAPRSSVSEAEGISTDESHPARLSVRYHDERVEVFECLGCDRDEVVEYLRLFLRAHEDRFAELLPVDTAAEDAKRGRRLFGSR